MKLLAAEILAILKIHSEIVSPASATRGKRKARRRAGFFEKRIVVACG
jgi:hypothetical protein